MPNNNEYAPTTREVRERFIDGFPIDTWVVARDDAGRDFDRWLAEHDRQVKAEALREHAKRLRYWTRDESQKLLRFSVDRAVADLEDFADRIEREGKNDE